MTRAKRSDLDEIARVINNVLGEPEGTYFVQYAYGQPRLFRDGGAREVSPRLPTGEMKLWMQAFVAGILAAKA